MKKQTTPLKKESFKIKMTLAQNPEFKKQLAICKRELAKLSKIDAYTIK